ncbi:MAG: NAD(P)-binding domain-containing protein, partial [Gemmatimonadetes bacterium]|nr:NAD(P)-binding domain-containing protein [Gemmatimonadota bacterium]
MIELAVIGAGPAGLAVGVAARQEGIGCVLFEKGSIVRTIAGYPTYMTFFSTAEKLELGGIPFVVVGDKPTRREALKYYVRVADHFQLDIHQYEEVVEVVRQDSGFRLRTRRHTGEEREQQARRVVVATGYFDTPNLLGVPGEDLPKVTH